VLRLLVLLFAFMPTDSAKLRAAALRGWAFLYTSLNTQFSSRQLEGLMATFAELLHDQEVEVRAAAGEGLALLYHTSGLADGNYEGFEGCDEDETLDEALEEEEDPQEDEEQQQQQAPAAAAALSSPGQSPRQQQQQGVDLSPTGPLSPPAAAAVRGSSGGGVANGLLTPLTPAAVAASTGKPPRRPDDAMSLASCSSVSGLDLVVDRMKDLASNKGDRQRRSKRERSVLKGAFRELRGVMEVSGDGVSQLLFGVPSGIRYGCTC
jgi:hypothetical protein